MRESALDATGDPSRWAGELDDRERAALMLADALCGSTRELDPTLVADLRRQFDEVELAELILVAGQANLNNRAGNAAKQLLGD